MHRELGPNMRLSAVGLAEDHVRVLVAPGEDAFAQDLLAKYGDKLHIRFGVARAASS